MGIIFLIIGLLICILFTSFTPHQQEFSPYNLDSSLELVGPLELNNKLNNAVRLLENEIKGPEGFAIYNNELYMSVHGGYILKLVNDKFIPVIKIGSKCDGIWEEKKCGRPLGLKFDTSGNLYFADAYSGIYKANVTTGIATLIIPSNVAIEGKLPMLPNSVDVAKDGTVYWSDSSTTHYLYDGLIIMLGNGSGRLLQYNPKTRINKVLIDKLHFANGVTLSADESFILVAETFNSRIMKYNLKGENSGIAEIFVDRLPGFPDNIQRLDNGKFSTCLIKPENTKFLLKYLAPYPSMRWFLANLLTIFDLVFQKINNYFPNYYAARATHWIGHFESMPKLLDERVSVIILNNEGKIVGSLYGNDNLIGDISDMIPFKGYYYLGSPYNPYLAKVKI